MGLHHFQSDPNAGLHGDYLWGNQILPVHQSETYPARYAYNPASPQFPEDASQVLIPPPVMHPNGAQASRDGYPSKPKDAEKKASSLREQFMKMQMCRFYVKGVCHRGEACEFAHGEHELKSAPDLRRTSICKKWLHGECAETAQSCRFAHGTSMLRRTFGSRDTQPSTTPSESMLLEAKDQSAVTAELQRALRLKLQEVECEKQLLRSRYREQEMLQIIAEQREQLREQAEALNSQSNRMMLNSDGSFTL